MSNLKRENSDGRDMLVTFAQFVAALAIVAALGVLAIAAWSMYWTPTPADAEVYRKELLQKEADPAWQAEQRRLRKKHGDKHRVIFERGQEPYYFDKTGKRCRYI